MKTYENMAVMLAAERCKLHVWQMCCNLQVVTVLLDLQSDLKKFCWFFHAMRQLRHNEPLHSQTMTYNWIICSWIEKLKNTRQVEPKKGILFLLNIQFGFMKIFRRVVFKNGHGFVHLRKLFPILSKTKVKDGIFFSKILFRFFFLWNRRRICFDNDCSTRQLQEYGFKISPNIHFFTPT